MFAGPLCFGGDDDATNVSRLCYGNRLLIGISEHERQHVSNGRVREGFALANVSATASRLLEGRWGDDEASLPPPVSLLSWLIRNLPTTGIAKPIGDEGPAPKRRELFEQNPETIRMALDLLSGQAGGKGWHVLEGASRPDAYLLTDDAIIVVEGKRTEAGPTVGTTWMPRRHQILRHLDAAWERRGSRRVYGMLIVEGAGGPAAVEVPPQWVHASLSTISTAAIADSLPHRGPAEQLEIARCFLGVTTWQAVCRTFDIDWVKLPHTAEPNSVYISQSRLQC